MLNKKWMLPEGVEESLPPLSWQMETLRRKLLDHYRKQGYELVLAAADRASRHAADRHRAGPRTADLQAH